nr:MAG TPA: hypothetical protein [Caudoviricetes sp.]
METILMLERVQYVFGIIGHTICWGSLLFVLPTVLLYPLKGRKQEEKKDGYEK